MGIFKKNSCVVKAICLLMMLSLILSLSSCGHNEKEIKQRLQALNQTGAESEENSVLPDENNVPESIDDASEDEALSPEDRVVRQLFDEAGFREAQNILDELDQKKLDYDRRKEVVDTLEKSVLEYGPKVKDSLTFDLQQETIEELVTNYFDLYKAYIETQHDFLVEEMGEGIGNMLWDSDQERLRNLETAKNDLIDAKKKGDSAAFNSAKDKFFENSYDYTVAVLEAAEESRKEYESKYQR